MVEQLDSEIWIADTPLRFLGLEVGSRMTIVRLTNGDLLLHSPISPTPRLIEDVKALGRVAYLVAPNRLHHLSIGEWASACPEAEIFGAPGLDTKRKDLKITGSLADQPNSSWADVLDQVVVEGFPFANEVVFFHRPSRTLIATDLAFNVGACSPPLTRFVFRLLRTYGRLAPTLLERVLIRDKHAFKKSLERILELPFERVIVSHGEVSESGGRAELELSYAWLPAD